MKRWMILVAIAVALPLYCCFLYVLYTNNAASQPLATEPSAEVMAVATVPATVETTVFTTQETTTVETTAPPQIPVLSARHAFVYNCQQETLLYALTDMNTQVAPASLTKLFTAYVVLQYLDPEDIVHVGEEVTWIDPHSSIASVWQGSEVTVKMLIQGMIMQSGNDAAYAAAVAAGRIIAGTPEISAREALDAFMQEMNRQAQVQGLSGSHFITPDGLDAEEHYTTPADLIRISCLSLQIPLIQEYASVKQDYVMFESGQDYVYQNTNWLLDPQSEYFCEAAIGLKTGTTSKAGNCLLALFTCDEGTLLIGVLGCPSYMHRFQDALALYHAFS